MENVDLPYLQVIQIGKAAFTNTASLTLHSLLLHSFDYFFYRFALLDATLLRKRHFCLHFFSPIERFSFLFSVYLELLELQHLEFGQNSFKSLLSLELELPKLTLLTVNEHSFAKLKSLTLNLPRLEVIDAKSYAMYFVETVEITGILS